MISRAYALMLLAARIPQPSSSRKNRRRVRPVSQARCRRRPHQIGHGQVDQTPADPPAITGIHTADIPAIHPVPPSETSNAIA